MSKFKEGNELWWFEFPENGCGGHYVEEITLHMMKIERGMSPQPFWDAAYKSKHEAVKAMIMHVLTIDAKG